MWLREIMRFDDDDLGDIGRLLVASGILYILEQRYHSTGKNNMYIVYRESISMNVRLWMWHSICIAVLEYVQLPGAVGIVKAQSFRYSRSAAFTHIWILHYQVYILPKAIRPAASPVPFIRATRRKYRV
jgi:hypothetical protein